MSIRHVWYTDGVASVTNDSKIVTGVGTAWLTYVKEGDSFALTKGGPVTAFYQVKSIESDTGLTLTTPYQGITETEQGYSAMRMFEAAWSVPANQAQQIQDLIHKFQIALRENLRGPEGAPGSDGNTIWSGEGAPDPLLGRDGDFYIDILSWNVYRRENSSWILRGNMKGPKGDPGEDGITWYWETIPSESIGQVGDANLNPTSGDVHRRELAGWVLIGNLKGAKGDTGPTGPQGAQGIQGVASAWYSGSADPVTTLGINGDMYLNSVSGDTFRKSSGVWTKQGNIKGPVGPQGPAGIPGVNFKGDWVAIVEYKIRDAVRYLGNLWYAYVDNIGVFPPSSSTESTNEAWTLMLPKGEDGQGSGDMLKAIYDVNNDGIVDRAKLADTATAAESANTAINAEHVPFSGVVGVPLSNYDTAGIVKLATAADTITGTSETISVTPLGLKAALSSAGSVPNATENVAGVIQLAPIAEVAAGTNETKALTPRSAIGMFGPKQLDKSIAERIFTNPTPDIWGIQSVEFGDGVGDIPADVGKTPIYMLYGTKGKQPFLVNTFGSDANTEQEVRHNNGASIFRRRRINNSWGSWVETGIQSIGNLSIYVDAINGNDSNIGTQVLPFKTLSGALSRFTFANCNVTFAVTIHLSPGTYEVSDTIYNFSRIKGGGITLRGLNSTRPYPVITNATGARFNYFFVSEDTQHLSFRYLDIKVQTQGDVTGAFNIINTNTEIVSCDLSYLSSGVYTYNSNVHWSGDCKVSNVQNLFSSRLGSNIAVNFDGGTYTNILQVFYALAGNIKVQGTHPNAGLGDEILFGGTISTVHNVRAPTAPTWISFKDAYTLPAGGTWVYWRSHATTAPVSGVVAGGTAIGAAGYSGLAWRIA